MTFTMARQILVEMAYSFGMVRDGPAIPPPIGYPIRLSCSSSTTSTMQDLTGTDAEELLWSLRAAYEPLLAGLAS